jgi:hypothetical protein
MRDSLFESWTETFGLWNKCDSQKLECTHDVVVRLLDTEKQRGTGANSELLEHGLHLNHYKKPTEWFIQ